MRTGMRAADQTRPFPLTRAAMRAHSWVLAAAAVVGACLVVPCAPTPHYFGWWDNHMNETEGFTNLQFTDSDLGAIADAASRGIKTMFPAHGQLFEGNALRRDWEVRIDALVANETFKSLLDNGTIIGFFLGDELVWNCMSQSNLTDAVDGMRRKFPRGTAQLWYNEAAFFLHPAAAHDSCKQPRPDYKIPANLDWFSVDIYHMDGYVPGWVNTGPRHYYETAIYPNISAATKAVLIPGSFGSHVNRDCNNSCYDHMCSHDADDFYAWAQQDPRIEGIFPWNWGGCARCNGSKWTPPHTCCMDEVGTRLQPLTSAAWAKIGREISNK